MNKAQFLVNHLTEAEVVDLTPEQRQLAISNMGLAVSFASDFTNIADMYNSRLDRDDILTSAKLGIFKAAKYYNPSTGVSFKNFARTVVKNYLKDVYRGVQKLSNKEVATLDADDRDEGEDFDSRKDSIEDINSESPSGNVDKKIIAKKLDNIIRSFEDPRVQWIIFGFMQNPPKSQQQLANELGISQAAVSRLYTPALNTMRNALIDMGITGFDEEGWIEDPEAVKKFKSEKFKSDKIIASESLDADYFLDDPDQVENTEIKFDEQKAVKLMQFVRSLLIGK